jgi:hypothetical protein
VGESGRNSDRQQCVRGVVKREKQAKRKTSSPGAAAAIGSAVSIQRKSGSGISIWRRHRHQAMAAARRKRQRQEAGGGSMAGNKRRYGGAENNALRQVVICEKRSIYAWRKAGINMTFESHLNERKSSEKRIERAIGGSEKYRRLS